MLVKDEARLGDLAVFINGFAFSSDNFHQGGDSVVRISNIKDGGVCKESCLKFDNKKLGVSNHFTTKKGDILIALSGATTGKIGVVDIESEGFYINQRVAIIRPRLIEYGGYILNVLQSNKLALLLLDSEGSAQPNLSTNDIALMKTLGVSGIKAFNAKSDKINSSSRAIGRAIKSLKQKIIHLDEYKTALIHNAVTKGLDAKGCRILDGTQVPQRTIRLKDCFESMCGGIWGDEFKKSDDNNISIVRVANFNMDSLTIDWAKGETVRNVPAVGPLRRLSYNDVILEKSGGGEKTPVGRAVNYQDSRPSTAANFTNILKPNADNDGRFLMYVLNSLYKSAWLMPNIKQNTGIQNLDCPSYLRAKVPLFSLNEQLEISKYLDFKNDSILSAKETINKKIALLIEYKKSLINESVTYTA